MEKEDRLYAMITGKTDQVCYTCKNYKMNDKDPMGIGGKCLLDKERIFGYQYCDKYDRIKEEKDICPICGEKIIDVFIGMRGSIKTCPNECYGEKIKNKYVKCPICKDGELSIPCMHGELYYKCNNKECGFEIKPEKIITILLNKG